MQYGNSFFSFVCTRHIGEFVQSGHDKGLYLTVDEVISLVNDGYVTDGRSGGLVIGKFHSEGGIHMLQPSGEKLKYVGEMEGYEYIINEFATKKYMDLLAKINRETQPDYGIPAKPFDIPVDIKTIDVRRHDTEIIFIAMTGHFIINRAASERHLRLLNTINTEL